MLGKILLALGAFGAGVGSTLLLQKRKNIQTCAKNEEIVQPQLLLPAVGAARQEEQSDEERIKCILLNTLRDFGFAMSENVSYRRGPRVTRYIFRPLSGTLSHEILKLRDDLAFHVQRRDVRIELPIPGQVAFAIEVENTQPDVVEYTDLTDGSVHPLEVPIGLDMAGDAVSCDLAKMPHLLVAGLVGTGKGTLVNSILLRLAEKNTPETVRFILADLRQTAFSAFATLPHLALPVISEVPQAVAMLIALHHEMERRFTVLRNASVRNITQYNEGIGDDPARRLPYLVVVLNEFEHLRLFENAEALRYLTQLLQKSRAVGIHLILSTCSTSSNVLSGSLRCNLPSRIAFKVHDALDSRVILEVDGAQELLGLGDMLYYPKDAGRPIRVQGGYLSYETLCERLEALCASLPKGDYIGELLDAAFMEQERLEQRARASTEQELDEDEVDPFDGAPIGQSEVFRDALDLALSTGKMTAALLQRRLGIGYAHAAWIIEHMEELGLVTSPAGKKHRVVNLQAIQAYLEHFSTTTEPDDGKVE